jgi:membrane-bound inhibitor of C-type lysozyme
LDQDRGVKLSITGTTRNDYGTSTRNLLHSHVVGDDLEVTLSGLTNGNYDVYYYAPTKVNEMVGTLTINGREANNIWGNAHPNWVEGQDGYYPIDDNATIQAIHWDRLSGVAIENGIITITGGAYNVTEGLSGLQIVRTGWVQEAYIKASNNDTGDYFGQGIALSGNTLAVGTHQEDSNQTTITNGNANASGDNSNGISGAVYVYKRTGTTWAQEAYIKASNNDAQDEFGRSVALDNETLVVGSSTSGSGAVYVYKRTGTTWAQEAYIKAVNSVSGLGFGSGSLALDNSTLVVGVPGESSNQTTITNGKSASSDTSNSSSGATYVYSFTGE